MFRSPLFAYRVSGRVDGIEPPLAGHALQLAQSTVLELDARPGDEILDGLRDEHFARSGGRGDASACVDGDSADLPLHQLALPGVQASADFDAEGTGRVSNSARGPYRSGRPSKVAKNPAPAVSTACPRKRTSSRRTR